METQFIPFKKMLMRLEASKQESDSAYFYDLLFLGEMLAKTIVSGVLAGIEDDVDRNRYRGVHRIVRADGIGEWSAVLEECLTGVASQYLKQTIRDNEQRELMQKVDSGQWQHDCVTSLYNAIKILDIQQYPELNKKLQAKNWFVHFAAIRNWTRGHGATLPVTCSNAIVPLEKSLYLFIENFYLFKREWAFLRQNISGKYRITNLNNGIENFELLKSTTEYSSKYENGVYIYYDDIINIELIESSPEADDFFYPNGNFRDKSYEMLSYITDKRIKGEGFKYLTPASELPKSETEGSHNLHVVGNCFTNLPKSYSEYIHRHHLEVELSGILGEENRYPIVTLKGLGGIGKTSLALSVLNQIAHTERYAMILWFSSRDIDLVAEGPKAVKNNILTEEDIAHEFVELVGKDIPKKERIAYLSEELFKSSFGNILFVFDNFETVKNPIDLFTWLDTYVRHPNKILITSRTSKSFKADYPIDVSGMTDFECRDLIEKTATNLTISHLMTHKVVENILQESSGHPYVIKIFLGQIAKDRKASEIKRVIAGKDDILTALFRRTYSWLSPAAKRVFLTLCSWRSLVPQIALEAVLMREANQRIDVESALEELKMSSFIDAITNSTEEETFLSVPLAAAVFGRSELQVSSDKFAILADRELLEDFGASKESDVVQGINSRIERKFKTIAKRITQHNESLDRHLPTLEFIASKYSPAWLYLASIHQESNNYQDEQNALREFLKTDSEEDLKKKVWQRLAESYKKNGDWFGEINALVEKCTLLNTTIFDISEVANVLNQYILQQKLALDSVVKENITKKLIDLFNKNISSNVSATDYSRLAWLYLRLDDESNAVDAVKKGLEADSENEYCIKLAQKLSIDF